MSAPAAEDLRGTDEPSPHVRSESDVLPYLAALTGLAVLIDAWPVETPMAAGAVALGTMMLAVLAFARQLSAMRTSAQEQSEATARNFAARFEALAQHSSDILTILDAQGRVEVVSPAVASVLGHYSWTYDDPLFRVIILRGLAWAAGESIPRFDAIATSELKLKE